MVDLHRRHIDAECRSIDREASYVALPDESAARLYQFCSGKTDPVGEALQRELRTRVATALERLPEPSREVLILRFVEQLSTKDTADSLGISVTAVQGRQFRALTKMRSTLDEIVREESR